MEERKLGRRGFLGLFAGAIATVAAAPIVVPKKSFFSFFLPKPKILEVPQISQIVLLPGQSIAEAIAKLPPSGGEILVSAGQYIMNQAIFLPANISIKGESLSLVSCEIEAMEPRKDPMFTLSGDHNLVSGCFIKGNGSGAAFSFAGSSLG